MLNEGPQLELLLRRMSACPPEFLETCEAVAGGPQLAAIIADHLRSFGSEQLTAKRKLWLETIRDRPADRKQAVRYWGVLGVATWLLHEEWFLQRPDLLELGCQWLCSDVLVQLSELVRPELVISDPDRREELVRLCLRAHGLRPAGEANSQSNDRLNTLDSVERQRILAATAEAERRAREVREAMARKRALESSSRYGE